MPIHPHECRACGTFDVITLSVRAEPDPTCPRCGKAAERRFGVPSVRTNTRWLADQNFGDGQFAGDPAVREHYLRAAKAAGVSTQGKVYQHGLARFPGDPEAFVDDVDDVKKILRKRGWGAESLGIKAREVEPEVTPIGEDLVDGELDAMVAGGALDPQDREKVRDDVRERITPHWHKNGKEVRPRKAPRRRAKTGKKG